MTNFERDIEDKMDKLREALDKVMDARMYADEAREAAEAVGVEINYAVIDMLEDAEEELSSSVDEAQELLSKLEMVLV